MGLFSKLLQKRKERVEAGRACYAEAPTASPARVVKERKERGELDRVLHARSSTTHAAPVDTKRKKKESIEVGQASYTGPSPAYAAKDPRTETKRDSLFGEVDGDEEGKRWSVDVKEALEMKWNEVLAKAGASDDANRVVQDRRYSSEQASKREESRKKEIGDRKSADAGNVFETKRSSRREGRRESSAPTRVDASISSGKEKGVSGTKERSRPAVPRRESSVQTRIEDQTMSGNGRSVSVWREKSRPPEKTHERSAPTRVEDIMNGSGNVAGGSKDRNRPVERSERRRESSAQTHVDGLLSSDSARRSRARDSKRTSQLPVEKKPEKTRDKSGANSRSLPKDSQERDKKVRDQEKDKRRLKEKPKQEKPPRSKWAELWTPEKVMDLAQEYKPKGREDPRVSAEFRGPPKYFFPTPRDSAEQSELDLRRLSANKRYSGDSFAGRRSSLGKAMGDSWGPEQRDWDRDSFDVYQGKKDERSADSSDESIFYSVNLKRKV